jgi:hypothetical protein
MGKLCIWESTHRRRQRRKIETATQASSIVRDCTYRTISHLAQRPSFRTNSLVFLLLKSRKYPSRTERIKGNWKIETEKACGLLDEGISISNTILRRIGMVMTADNDGVSSFLYDIRILLHVCNPFPFQLEGRRPHTCDLWHKWN